MAWFTLAACNVYHVSHVKHRHTFTDDSEKKEIHTHGDRYISHEKERARKSEVKDIVNGANIVNCF